MREDGTLDAVNSRCVQQGLTTPATCTDHVVPLRHGGAKYDPNNLRSLCASCNGWKERTIERRAGSRSGSDGRQTVASGRFSPVHVGEGRQDG
jgi:5-methylcytosine-specific restriction endonuclease McrA